MFLSADLKKDTLLFPVYNEKKERVGVKMRTIDGTSFHEGKSGNVKGGNTGCIYDTLGETIIICE
jgi:hypothetical protein